MERKIGIYSGTFDPVHPGHLAFANAALQANHLDEIIFLPEPRPRGKAQVTDLAHRIALIERAIADQPKLRVLQVKSDQFTVAQTLPELRRLFPDARLTLLVGSDVVKTFPYRWDGLKDLVQKMDLSVGMRATDTDAEITAILAQLERDIDTPITYTLVHTPQAHAASSQFRGGAVGEDTLHPSSRKYIRENRLYS